MSAVLVYEYNPGIDGWDAKSTPVAIFDSEELAEQALFSAGFTEKEPDRSIYGGGHRYYKSRGWGDRSYFIQTNLSMNWYDFQV